MQALEVSTSTARLSCDSSTISLSTVAGVGVVAVVSLRAAVASAFGVVTALASRESVLNCGIRTKEVVIEEIKTRKMERRERSERGKIRAREEREDGRERKE